MVKPDKSSGKHKKHIHRTKKHSHIDYQTSESSNSDESPQRHKKSKDLDKTHKKRSIDHDITPERRSKHGKYDSPKKHYEKRKDDKYSDERKEKRERRRSEERLRIKIKKEEDFDRKQEELRRNRRKKENEEKRSGHHSSHLVTVKQEPDSDTNPRRNREGGQRRRDIEQERRDNDARRAEAWQRRERQGGGQNAEALVADEEEETKEKEKPNLGLSGALTEDTNTFRGVVIKYNEPPEARQSKKKWRLYPFKGDEALKVLHLHRQSAYLLGKLRRIADIPIDHPSCSKQHAVLQFRLVETETEDGRKKRTVKPYIIDLESANGTFVNNKKIEPRRYVELKEKDVIKFAYSSREYVLIHDKSDTSEVQLSDEEDDE